jgi:DNA invertase Pin-like site-specific DNA recombinase
LHNERPNEAWLRPGEHDRAGPRRPAGSPEGSRLRQSLFREEDRRERRPGSALQRLLRDAEAGDVVVVTRLDRLARSTRDLLNILGRLTNDGIGFQSLRETAIDTTTAYGRLTIFILAAFAEFERELIQGRVQEGRKRAVAAGVKFAPKFKLDGFQRREALARLDAGETLSAIARTYGVDPATICRPQKRSAA